MKNIDITISNNRSNDDLQNLKENFRKQEVLENQQSSKAKNVKFYNFLETEWSGKNLMTEKTLERISICGNYLQFLGDRQLEHIKLENANFCGHRFCPQCAANKAREQALQIATMLEYLKQEKGYEFIFLTLTAPNVPAEDVEEELKNYFKAFKRLRETKAFKKISKGYIRKIEMTYNKTRNDFHPHYHIMIAVSRSYFTQSSQYISQRKWLEMWRKAKRDPNITQVDVRKFKNMEDLFKAVFEMAKYISKDSDYMHSGDVFDVFYRSLKGKRMLSYSEEFKEAVKLYKSGVLEQYMGEDPNEHIEWVYRLWYKWEIETSSYAEAFEKQKLSQEDYEMANMTRKEKFKFKQIQREEVKKLNEADAKERRNRKASMEKTKDYKTGEMTFDPGEKKSLELIQKQAEFDRVIYAYNQLQKLKHKQLEL